MKNNRKFQNKDKVVLNDKATKWMIQAYKDCGAAYLQVVTIKEYGYSRNPTYKYEVKACDFTGKIINGNKLNNTPIPTSMLVSIFDISATSSNIDMLLAYKVDELARLSTHVENLKIKRDYLSQISDDDVEMEDLDIAIALFSKNIFPSIEIAYNSLHVIKEALKC